MLDRVRDRLSELRTLDPGYRVFGANKHQYLSTPASVAEVADAERRLGVALPVEYRRFLLEVGYGAGP